ncbi:hypothetical protein GGF41_002149, partial [Coemansia sp. RSA 2531]
MSFVISDSEGEDTHPAPPPKFRPRVVNRPTPVRARRASSSTNTSKGKEVAGGAAALHLSDSDDDEDSGSDDTSFFRMGRPSLGLTSAIDANDSDGSEREAPKAPSVSPPPQVTTDTRLESIDYSDSDSQDDDNVGNRLQQHYGSAEKRKHSDNSDQADHSRLRRSRSVSLTPPPEPHRASTTLGQKTRQDSTEPDVQVLDSDSDTDIVATASTSLSQRLRMEESLDLDPALRAIVQSSSATRRQTARPATTDIEVAKAHIEFHFIYDEEFLQYDLPRIWEHKRWGQVSLQNRPKVTKRLDARIAVVVFMSETMEKALQTFSDHFSVNVVATDPVLMMNSMRVFPTSTMASFGIRPVYYVTVYPRSVFNREREREALERARRAMEREQAQRGLEMAQTLHQSADATESHPLPVDDDLQSAGDSQQGLGMLPGNTGKPLRIKVRDKSGKDTLLLVTTATTVQAIIDNYV